MPNHETLSPEDFKKELSQSDTTLIDIRTTWEQESFWVISPDQEHIDITLANTTQKLEALDLKGKYLVYCWHWLRSKRVLEYMQSQGFEYVKDLDWGIDAWNKINT